MVTLVPLLIYFPNLVIFPFLSLPFISFFLFFKVSSQITELLVSGLPVISYVPYVTVCQLKGLQKGHKIGFF